MANKNSFGGCMTKIIAIDWKGRSSFIGSTQKGKEYISGTTWNISEEPNRNNSE